MALFTSNLTIKTQRDGSTVENFIDSIKPGARYGLFPGELAMYVEQASVKLFTLDYQDNVVEIKAGINTLVDTIIEDPQQGQILEYDGEEDAWRNVFPPAADISGNNLNDLKDVDLFQVQRDDQLVYIGGDWVNRPGWATFGISAAADVDVTFPLDGQTLVWKSDTEQWENEFAIYQLNDLIDVDIESTLPLDGDVLLYDSIRARWVPGAVAGGNANVIIIEDEDNLPAGKLTTLGVSPIDETDPTEGGNFYWATGEAETDTDWNQAVKIGDASIGDFKDINIDGIEVGDGLIWTFSQGNFQFRPHRYVSEGVNCPTNNTNGDALTYQRGGSFFDITGYGDNGARWYAVATAEDNELDPANPREYLGLGMYGESATEPGIHVSYDKVDEGWKNGLLRFPTDLQADSRNGLWGVRPLNNAGSWDISKLGYGGVDPVTGKLQTSFALSFYIENPDSTCDLVNTGYLRLFLLDGRICVAHQDGDVVYTNRLLDLNTLTQKLHQIFVNVGDGRLSIVYNGDLLARNNGQATNDTSWGLTPLDSTFVGPVLGENFAGGYMGDFRVLDGFDELWNDATNPVFDVDGTFWKFGDGGDSLWITNSVGQYVKGTPGEFTCTMGYDEDAYYNTGNFQFLSVTGSSVLMVELADVDTQKFVDLGLGAPKQSVLWNPATQKFEPGEGTLEVEAVATLQGATDVSLYDPVTDEFIRDGQTLVYYRPTFGWVPGDVPGSFRINSAEDVDVSAGLYSGNILAWNSAAAKWSPTNAPNQPAIELDELTDVNLSYNTPQTGYTLVYSEALDEWVAAPAPWTGANEVSELEDVDLDGLKDGDILMYSDTKQKWVPTDSPDPQVLDDLLDVDTTARPPKEGQALGWSGANWIPKDFIKGGASNWNDLWDVNADHAVPGDGLVWDGLYWRPAPIATGRGDGGDFSIGYVLASYVSGVYGGGDFDTETADIPTEQQGFVDGGLFT